MSDASEEKLREWELEVRPFHTLYLRDVEPVDYARQSRSPTLIFWYSLHRLR
jgi:hypothetical protein